MVSTDFKYIVIVAVVKIEFEKTYTGEIYHFHSKS